MTSLVGSRAFWAILLALIVAVITFVDFDSIGVTTIDVETVKKTQQTDEKPTPNPTSAPTGRPTPRPTVKATEMNNEPSKNAEIPPATSSPTPAPIEASNDLHVCFPKDPDEEQQEILQLVQEAMDVDKSNLTVTCLNETAFTFTRLAPDIQQLDETWERITISFQARDCQGNPQANGGDEFVLYWQGWASDGTWSVQTASQSTDQTDGTYTTVLQLPRIAWDSWQTTLVHGSTRYEGMTGLAQDGPLASKIDFGPVEVETDLSLQNHWSTSEDKLSLQQFQAALTQRPACAVTQEGVEQMAHGIWIQPDVEKDHNLTLQAEWYPFCCKPVRTGAALGVQLLRIGDSMMPYPTIKVGDAFSPTIGAHNDWINFLLSLPEYNTEATVVVSLGLHFALHGKFKPAVALQVARRMACQFALKFPGRILFVDVPPIQQQVYPQVDMTNLYMRNFRALARQERQETQGLLREICKDSRVDLFTAFSTPEGDLRDEQESAALLELIHQSDNATLTTRNETELVQWYQSLDSEAREALYGNRTVWSTGITDFLLSRPETYREHDKVHDLKEMEGGQRLFFGAHSTYMADLLKLRAEGET